MVSFTNAKVLCLITKRSNLFISNCFQPYNNAEEKPVIKVKLASMKRIFQRRYLLRPLGKFQPTI